MLRTDNHWMVIPKLLEKAKIRMFCLPYAGGGISTYIKWAENLPDWVELCIIQSPGRSSRLLEPPCVTMDALVENISFEIKHLLDIPYVIFGHSLGSRVGYELIRSLLAKGFREPYLFFASAGNAPHIHYNNYLHTKSDN